MPEFYLVPKGLAQKAPFLVKLAHRFEAALFRCVFRVIRRLSLERALRLSGSLFYHLGRFSNKQDKALRNLQIAFPDKEAHWYQSTAREIFRHLGYSAVELIKYDQIWDERDTRLEFVFEPGAREHLQSGKATVFMTAHVGAWQIAPMILRSPVLSETAAHRESEPFDRNSSGPDPSRRDLSRPDVSRPDVSTPDVSNVGLIYAPESNPVMDGLMMQLRSSLSENLIPADAGPRPILRELNGGNSIIVAGDTRPDTGKLMPFFGRDALANTSIIGLALRANASVALGRAERLPGARYRVTLYPPLETADASLDVKEQAIAMTREIHHYFERWIEDAPEQWVCLKRRWPKAHKL